MKLKIKPCTNVEEKTVKEYLAKIDEELNEVKELTLERVGLGTEIQNAGLCFSFDEKKDLADEILDTITTLITFATKLGIDRYQLKQAAFDVYRTNKARGRVE